jgi:hypothetical protein
MWVLSGVFNTTIFGAAYYVKQDYACQLHTYICLHNTLSNRQPIKKRDISYFCLEMAQYRSLIGQALCTAICWSTFRTLEHSKNCLWLDRSWKRDV